MDRKMIGAICFIVLGLLIIFSKPFIGSGLPAMGHEILGVVLITLGLWIFKPGNVPLTAGSSVVIFGALAVISLHVASGHLLDPATGKAYTSGQVFAIATNGFVTSTVWTLLPALYFGFVLQKTGLGKRLAYLVLKSFKPSWATIAVSWFIIGVVLSALTPSILVRVAIILPIAFSIVDACKLEHRSKGAAYVTLLAFGMCVFPGTGWLTGSLSGPLMQGFLPVEMKGYATSGEWLRVLCLPWMLITVLYAVFAYIFTKPNQPIAISVDTFRAEYKKLGKMSRDETIVLVTLLIVLVLFFTERIHHVPSAAVAMAALFVFIMTKIIDGPEISTGISWDTLVFFGAAVGLSQLFRFAGITDWFSPLITPAIQGLAPHALLLMLVLTVGLMLIRFLDVPWGFTTIALTASLTTMLFTNFGYHPLVITMAFLICINFFLLSYQQPWLLMAEGMLQNKGWAPNHVVVFGAIYIVAALVALVAVIPYWKLIGVLSMTP
ncbi:MAG: SLC13 family permease [Firmicutes bacterium]|nr:SLC13 family permease [Bacillota bacterium]